MRNTKSLLESCTGEYIAYLDADDFWKDQFKLDKQIKFMNDNPDYSLCITGFLQLIEDNEYIPCDKFQSWLCPSGDLSTENLSVSNIVGSSSSRLFRNYDDLFDDYFYQLPYSDWVINFELSLRGKIGYLNFPSYVYRLHSNSLSNEDSEILISKYSNTLKIKLDNYQKNKK